MNVQVRFENAPANLIEQFADKNQLFSLQIGNTLIKRLTLLSANFSTGFNYSAAPGRIDLDLVFRQEPPEQPKAEEPKISPEPPPIPKQRIDPQQIKDLIETATPVVLDILSIVKALRRRR